MNYKEFIVALVKDEHFDTLINDIRNNLLNKIAATQPEDKEKREGLYFQLKGVEAVKSAAVLAAKRKVTGGNE